MAAKVLAILRRPDGLTRVVQTPDANPSVIEQGGSGDPSLDRAWAGLARLDPNCAADLEALRRVWCKTMPAKDGWVPVPLPKAVQPPGPHRATAAHPRAYAGTTHKPPKPGKPVIDVRPFMERWENVCRVLSIEEPDPFQQQLWSEGGDLDSSSEFPTKPGFELDSLAPDLRQAASRFTSATVPELLRLDRAVRRLDQQLPPWALLTGTGTATDFAGWFEAALLLPPEVRGPLLRELTSGLVPAAESDLPVGMARVAALAGDVSTRAKRFVAALRRGASPSYAASAFELEIEYPGFGLVFEDEVASYGERPWPITRPGRVDVTEVVRAVVRRLDPDGKLREQRELIPESLFDRLGALPGALEFVQWLVGETSLTREEFSRWLDFPRLLSISNSELWRLAVPELQRAYANTRSLPVAERVAYPDHLLEALLGLEGEAADATHISERIDLAFKTMRYGVGTMDVIESLLREGHRFPTTDVPLRALDAVARRRADRWLLCNGLKALFECQAAYVFHMLEHHSKALLRLARAMGAMHPARLAEAIHRAAGDELWANPPTLDALESQMPHLDRIAPHTLSRTLREHFAGSRTLSAGQTRRALLRSQARWDLVRTRLIERETELELQRGVSLDPKPLSRKERHALSLLAISGRHRRGLRRVLRGLLNDDPTLLTHHPKSQAWFNKHPRLKQDAWRGGIRLQGEVESIGKVDLAVEQDFLEVLRMGDYVRTCLALGAGFDADPVGIALDVNKVVVYARDAEGRVVARQLLAVSEEETLVCYPVYALPRNDAFDALFVEYDRSFAQTLGVEIADKEYYVDYILSQTLWDDGLWERVEQPR